MSKDNVKKQYLPTQKAVIYIEKYLRKTWLKIAKKSNKPNIS